MGKLISGKWKNYTLTKKTSLVELAPGLGFCLMMISALRGRGKGERIL